MFFFGVKVKLFLLLFKCCDMCTDFPFFFYFNNFYFKIESFFFLILDGITTTDWFKE